VDKRKIVRSGNTSYTVALPIDWIRKNNLSKGSFVNMFENNLGEVVISTNTKPNIQKEITETINIDDYSYEKIDLELHNAYIRNISTIILEGKDISSKIDIISSYLNTYIGLDIIEHNPSNIVIKNFSSNEKEMSSEKLLRKMDICIRAMFDLTLNFFNSGFSKNDLLELERLKNQDNRIYLLTRRMILTALNNPHLIREFHTSYHQLSKDKIIAMSFKQIAFFLLSIGRSFLYLKHTKDDAKKLKKLFWKLFENYGNILNRNGDQNHKSLIEFLDWSRSYILNLETKQKTERDPLILEVTDNIIVINKLLRRIAFEIIE